MAGGEAQALESLRYVDAAYDEGHILNATWILELANKAYSLYVRQTLAERAKLSLSCL
jgi:hypothetical protein